jgi:hypothetical protein
VSQEKSESWRVSFPLPKEITNASTVVEERRFSAAKSAKQKGALAPASWADFTAASFPQQIIFSL